MRSYLPAVFLLWLVHCVTASVGHAAPAALPLPLPPLVRTLVLHGADRTREETVRELLPRALPARYTAAELREFERRLRNLAIFDDVRVQRRGDVLAVFVRERWTLIPTLDFASGETFADSYFLLGAIEYNLFGTANELAVELTREQRGWGFAVALAEHTYRLRRWAVSSELAANTAQLRFEEGEGWTRLRTLAGITLTSPPLFHPSLNFSIGAEYEYEHTSEARGGARPPGDSHALQNFVSLLWDAFRDDDLTPSGFRATLTLGTGFLLASALAQPRHFAELDLTAALPLARYTVLALHGFGGALTRGNANFSFLLGTLEGVRGLPDSLYRNWLQGYANIELRQGVPLAERWALQVVAFGDTAAFERLTARGQRGATATAISVGAGLRVIPTWLAGILLRGDFALVLHPEPGWLFTFGGGQYF